MKPSVFIVLSLIFAARPGLAGNAELALAALVGLHSPRLANADKALLEKFLDSDPKAGASAAKFAVAAEAVTCRSSDVDITSHSCELDFDGKKILLKGRQAHELYATLIENGVSADGAAGSIYEAIVKLDCAIDPSLVKEESGGGASCKFKTVK